MAKDRGRGGAGGGTDSNAWMVTFSDLLTLLMTFFVMLLSMSSMDKNRLENLASALRGAVGVLEGGARGEIQPPQAVVHRASVGNSMAAQIKQALATLEFDKEGENTGRGIEVLQEGDEVLITLPESIAFRPGSATFSPQARQVLERVGPVLKRWNYPIQVQGHSDGGGEVPERQALRISLRRATAVVNVLQSLGIAGDKMMAGGYGTSRPADSNLTAEGRARNRRVELIVSVDPGP